ncbi:MAG: D-cysteine desulfhydrase family protein [Deltaproteobacteria bacterium]|nr:D-cysteine desulfhydrase family protein [Deltaproteobacteria bacterium]
MPMVTSQLGAVDRAIALLPRVQLADLPTPLTRLSRLSHQFGRHLYCKRDDLTGFAFGGNKARKLEFLVANARQACVDTLVAIGGMQSNFCRMAAAAAARAGLDCFLVLGGSRPRTPTGNIVLDQILGAHLNYCESEDWQDWEAAAEQLTARLRRRGRNVFSMPIGGSTPIGAIGYAVGMAEILRDARRLGVAIDHIVHASSSGGTQAGLLVGKALTGWPGEIHGISVAGNKVELANRVYRVAAGAAQLVGAEISPHDVHVDDAFVGAGYGKPTEAGLVAIETFARQEGIFLDRVYTGKAGAALLSYLDVERFGPDEVVLFLHTGGAVELFAQYPRGGRERSRHRSDDD